MAVNVDVNLILLILCIATDLLVIVAAFVSMVNVPVFQLVIIMIYVIIATIAVLLSDIYRPVLCSEFFGFLKFFWGRALLYLLLGALVFQDSQNVTFNKFVGGWTWAIALLFAILALVAFADKNKSLPTTVEPFKNADGKFRQNNTSAMSSNGGA